jgi:hypothetical protein
MNAFQTAFSSARFNRFMYGLGAVVVVAGLLVLASTVIGGSDKTNFGPDPDFKATLPVPSKPLKTADGRTVRRFRQLDPGVRSTIRTFISTAVARKHLDQSWAVIAPSMKVDYTYKKWTHAHALPVVPYPVADINRVSYYLEYASTEEVLIEVGLAAKRELKVRPARFLIGLVPVGTGTQKQWLVDYWMPRWTPVMPMYQ